MKRGFESYRKGSIGSWRKTAASSSRLLKKERENGAFFALFCAQNRDSPCFRALCSTRSQRSRVQGQEMKLRDGRTNERSMYLMKRKKTATAQKASPRLFNEPRPKSTPKQNNRPPRLGPRPRHRRRRPSQADHLQPEGDQEGPGPPEPRQGGLNRRDPALPADARGYRRETRRRRLCRNSV